MYIKRKVFSSVIDEETGEERLFSTTGKELEQREFNSKSMKAFRSAYDYSVGLKALKKSGGIGDNNIRDIIRVGRREIKPEWGSYIPIGSNGAINAKARAISLTTGANAKREIRDGERGLKFYKKKAGSNTNEIKRIQGFHDHGVRKSDKEAIRDAKEIMSAARFNKNLYYPS